MVVIRAADRGVNKEANILPHHKLKNVLLIAFLLNILTEFQYNWFPSLCILLHKFKNNISVCGGSLGFTTLPRGLRHKRD